MLIHSLFKTFGNFFASWAVVECLNILFSGQLFNKVWLFSNRRGGWVICGDQHHG